VARLLLELVPGSSISYAPPAPQDPTNRCPDLTLIRSLLPGWSCKVPYEEGVARTLAWFRDAHGTNLAVPPLQQGLGT
jgi:nucleoside-diphosphate-sugar epimerase